MYSPSPSPPCSPSSLVLISRRFPAPVMSTPEVAAAPAPVEEVKPEVTPAVVPEPVVEAPKVEEPVAAVPV